MGIVTKVSNRSEASFNVNGIRAIIQKDFEADMKALNPDFLCLQETKAQDDQVQEALKSFEDYHIVSNSAVKKGYSGTAILSKDYPRYEKVFFFANIMRNGVLAIFSTLIAFLIHIGRPSSPISILKTVPSGFTAMGIP